MSAVFLNVPFDAAYEPLFIALIAALAGLGCRPRCVLEIVESGQGRLARLASLMQSCAGSIHDLSRVSDARRPFLPRFNMPFELGIAWSISRRPGGHKFFVFEQKPYRLQKTLSDLNLIDPQIHRGTVGGVLRSVLNCLARTDGNPTIAALRKMFKVVKKHADVLKRAHGVPTVYSPEVFRQLVYLAVDTAERMSLIA